MEQCVTNQEFAKAAELKKQITELEEQKEILDSEENSFSQTVRSEEKVCNSQGLNLRWLNWICEDDTLPTLNG